MPENTWLFVGNYVDFYYGLYRPLLSSPGKSCCLSPVSVLWFPANEPDKTLIKCPLYALFQLMSVSSSQSLPLTFSYFALEWHTGLAQQTSQTVNPGLDPGALGLFWEGPWGFRKQRLVLFYALWGVSVAHHPDYCQQSPGPSVQNFLFESLRREASAPN